MPCSPKLKRCVDDLIAQGKPESSAWAICRSQLGEALHRHPDFEKIYRQFMSYDDGENRYYKWITALNLDETRQYGDSRRERFGWTRRHVDFQMWKEDVDAKYWQVEAGFPVESMNRNVYSDEELQESARTLAHDPVNLNHKYNLPTIDIPAAKYEDGLVEAILRIPKNLRCPICDTNKTINDLIESGGIVNVSLEAVCTLESDDPHKCEGMEFTGLSLLTKDTLPGIPLTRLMPLESIMVEALQVSTRGETKMKKPKIKLKAKVKEQADDCPEGQTRNLETGECEPKKTEQGQPEPHCPENQHYDVTQHKCVPDSAPAIFPKTLEDATSQIVTPPPAPTRVKPDAYGQCPEGWKLSTLLGTGEEPYCVPMADEEKTQQVEDSIEKDLAATKVGTSAVSDDKTLVSGPALAHKGPPTGSLRETTYSGEPAAVKELPPIITRGDETPPQMHAKPLTTPGEVPEQPIEPQTARSTSGDRHLGMPEGDTGMHPTAPETETPKEPHVCPDGQHWSDESNACMPDTDLTETVRRIKAEYGLEKAREDAQYIEKVWIEKYSALDGEYRNLLAGKRSTDKFYKDRLNYERRRNEALTKDYQESEIARREVNNRFAEVDREKRKIEGYITDLQLENEEIKKKYHGALATNLQLSRKNTQTNEDYLQLAKERDELKEKLGKARVMAKKTLKLKV